MKKIQISLLPNALVFDYKETSETSILDKTNIINTKLVFSTEYILKNKRMLRNFIDELLVEQKITTIKISNYELANDIFELLSILKHYNQLYFAEEKSIPFTLADHLIEIKHLTKINCFSIPPYLIELFDRASILVTTRIEMLFTSKFMENNNLSQYSKIYYKTNIRIEDNFDINSSEDFETFCKINRYLKVIHLYYFNVDVLTKITTILKENRIKNIKILIHKNINDIDTISILKKTKKELKLKEHIKLSLVYSDKYLKDNFFKQIIVNFLKVSAFVITLLVAGIFASLMINNYFSEKKINKINDDISKIIAEIENTEPTPEEIPEEVPEEKVIRPKYEALLQENDETVGWLKLNNTNIDYPVVQAEDNDFYLTHDYYKNGEFNGWVFMDFRNGVKDLDKNTIVYGHNRYYSGVIFGTLNNALDPEWYNKPENQLITFDTLYEDLEWEIFSVYKIKKTSDYIQTDFKDDEQYFNFLQMLSSRSIHNFNQNLNAETKILTLSTCLENDSRLVVHAKLKTE